MISRVIALSYGEMKELVKDRQLVANNCFISITGSFPMHVFPANAENILTLNFDDIYQCDVMRYDDFAGILFEARQADKIFEFLHYHSLKPGDKTLYVNCAAGVSRSGAVAAFANQLLCLSKEKFRTENPRISPNTHVTEVLRTRWDAYGRFLKPTELRKTWLMWAKL